MAFHELTYLTSILGSLDRRSDDIGFSTVFISTDLNFRNVACLVQTTILTNCHGHGHPRARKITSISKSKEQRQKVRALLLYGPRSFPVTICLWPHYLGRMGRVKCRLRNDCWTYRQTHIDSGHPALPVGERIIHDSRLYRSWVSSQQPFNLKWHRLLLTTHSRTKSTSKPDVHLSYRQIEWETPVL